MMTMMKSLQLSMTKVKKKSSSSLSVQKNASPVVTRSRAAAMAKESPKAKDTDITEQQQQQELEQLKSQLQTFSHSIMSLHWQRIKPNHKDWTDTISTTHQRQSWYYQSYYLDKATHLLPPCAYNSTYPRNKYGNVHIKNGIDTDLTSGGGSSRQSHEYLDSHNDFDEIIDRHRPKCETPLSILYTVTCGNGLHLYSQGRYRVLQLPCPLVLCNRFISITASSDLSQVLVCTKTLNVQEEEKDDDHNHEDGNRLSLNSIRSTSLVLYSIPYLSTKRFQLQIITSSYCSIMSHLTQLHDGTTEISAAWSGSLRQLDTKFDQLSTLLSKYGVMPPGCNTTLEKMTVVRKEFMNYIFGGHSTCSTNTSNAMDQFFTHPLMNDQLLQRLVRSLEANVAGVEGMIRKKMLAPVRAFMYDVSELHGLVKSWNMENECDYKYTTMLGAKSNDEVDYNLPLMNDQTSLRLYEASEVLSVIAEQCVSQLVEIRFRLSAMMAWIRGTSSQVKARGTAIDSVQRENAKKRRVPEKTVRKIASFLSTALSLDCKDNSKTMKRGSSECVLGILFSDYFTKNKVKIEAPPSPLTPTRFNESKHIIETPSIKAALEVSTQIAIDLFDEPSLSLHQSSTQSRILVDEFMFDEHSAYNQHVVAVHDRIGAAPNSTPDVEKCFNPQIKDDSRVEADSSRHWMLVANTCDSTTQGKKMLQLSAFPDCHGITQLDEFEQFLPHFYLTTFIVLPGDAVICNIQFYGNDGNSTLTSETSPNDEEGRQALSISTQNNDGKEELWLFNYDKLDFRRVNIDLHTLDETNDLYMNVYKFNQEVDHCSYLRKFGDEDDEGQVVVWSKCEYHNY